MSANLEAIAHDIAAAHRDSASRIAASRLTSLTRADALAIQGKVLDLLGDKVPVVKVAIGADGIGLGAPIPSSLVVDTGGEITLGQRDLVGLEVEVAARLKADITPEMAKAGPEAMLAAIEHFTIGIELIGSRIDDRTAAGAFGPMADNLVTGGYVTGTLALKDLPSVDGLSVKLTVNGVETQKEVAKHPFGDALRPILAFALAGDDAFGGLRKGMVVTTGSLSPLLISPRQGRIEITLGDFPPLSVTLR